MKTVFIAVFLFMVSDVFSQDIGNMLQNGKWYALKDKKGKIVYSRTAKSDESPSYEFRENGKIIHCGMTTETSIDANGKEITSGPDIRCDSVWHYELKNDKIRIQLLKQPADHYKIAKKGENLELTPLKAEEYK